MLTQKQLINYYKKAVKKKGMTPQNLIELLESRLDNIIYRMGLASTIFHAQQLISHGHILVDGKKVDRRSFQVKPNMIISLKEKSRNNSLIKENLAMQKELPEYISFDPKTCEGKLEIVPELEQIPLPLPVNVPLVCEFLAHTC